MGSFLIIVFLTFPIFMPRFIRKSAETSRGHYLIDIQGRFFYTPSTKKEVLIKKL